MDIQFFHRLTALSLVVHSYFWITFHKKSSWFLQFLFALTWLIYAYFSASGLIVDPSVLYQAQHHEVWDLQSNLWQIFSLTLGLPMCTFLFLSNTELCSHHMQGVKAFRSVIFDSATPIQGKSLLRFHLTPWKSANQIHLFRYIQASQGSFRIVVRNKKLQANFGSRLFLKFFFQVHEIDRDAYDLYQFVDQTEDVPVVVFDSDDQSIAVSAALKVPLQDIYEGFPSEACALHRYQVHLVPQEPFIADLGPSAPFEKFMKWQTDWIPQLKMRRHRMEQSYANFVQTDSLQCAQCRLEQPHSIVCPIENTCSV